MSAVPKLKEPLDPTRWRRISPGVYEQQDGIGRLERSEDDTMTPWTVLVSGRAIGAWPTFRLAKQHAHHLTTTMLAG